MKIMALSSSGMVMLAKPLEAAIDAARAAQVEAGLQPKVVYLSPQGSRLDLDSTRGSWLWSGERGKAICLTLQGGLAGEELLDLLESQLADVGIELKYETQESVDDEDPDPDFDDDDDDDADDDEEPLDEDD